MRVDDDLVQLPDGLERGISRRRFLRSGAFGVAGVMVLPRLPVGSTIAPPAASPSTTDCLPIWAAAVHNGSYYALANDGATRGVRQLQVSPDDSVELGDGVALDVSSDVELITVGSAGGRLLIGGGVWKQTDEVVVDNRPELYPESEREAIPEGIPLDRRVHPVLSQLPALFDVTDGKLKEIALPLGEDVVFGTCQRVTVSRSGQVVAIVGAATDPEVAFTTRLDAFEASSSGWSRSTVVDGLWEPQTVFAIPDGKSLWAVFVDGNGNWRTFLQASEAKGWVEQTDQPHYAERFEVLAVIPTAAAGAAVAVRSDDGSISIKSWAPGAALSASASSLGADVVDVLGVAGALGQAIVVGKGGSYLVELG